MRNSLHEFFLRGSPTKDLVNSTRGVWGSSGTFGDVNGDGAVNCQDLTIAARSSPGAPVNRASSRRPISTATGSSMSRHFSGRAFAAAGYRMPMSRLANRVSALLTVCAAPSRTRSLTPWKIKFNEIGHVPCCGL